MTTDMEHHAKSLYIVTNTIPNSHCPYLLYSISISNKKTLKFDMPPQSMMCVICHGLNGGKLSILPPWVHATHLGGDIYIATQEGNAGLRNAKESLKQNRGF